MRSTPKLQDTLEVFLEQMEELKVLISQTKDIEPLLNDKIEVFKQLKIEPNMTQFKNLNHQLLDDLSQDFSRFQSFVQNNYTKLEALHKTKKDSLSNYFFYILIAFVITSTAVYFGINGQVSKSNLNDEIVVLKSYNSALEEYIKESNQIDKYNKWLEEKRSKK